MTQQPTTKPILPSDSGAHCIDIPPTSDVTVLSVEYSTARPNLDAGWIFFGDEMGLDEMDEWCNGEPTVAVRRKR